MRNFKIPPPGPSDWLANHAEPRQTFEQERLDQPDKMRRKLYLQPLDECNLGLTSSCE